jgi:hypothetical protein
MDVVRIFGTSSVRHLSLIDDLEDDFQCEVPALGRVGYTGPDVLAIGYVPCHSPLDCLPGAFAARRKRWLAYKGLFWSGNPKPPEAFDDGRTELEQFILGEQYRIVCWIRDLSLSEPVGGMSRVRFKYAHRIGFTPIPLSGIAKRRHPCDWNRKAGTGSAVPAVLADPQGNAITVSLTVRFKLGGLANWAMFALTGHFAPFAWVRIDCRFGLDRVMQLFLAGSAVPTRLFYLGWRLAGYRDMISSTDGVLESFILAGDSLDAPEATPPPSVVWDEEAP